jgi:ribosomal protein S18 acetylase RimI-like enzyme
VVYQNEKPVGTGTLVSNDKIGGIYNIATLSEYQKKGCGNAMMRHLMNRAQELDLKVVVLLSSAAGFKLYSDLGFIADLDFDFYC